MILLRRLCAAPPESSPAPSTPAGSWRNARFLAGLGRGLGGSDTMDRPPGCSNRGAAHAGVRSCRHRRRHHPPRRPATQGVPLLCCPTRSRGTTHASEDPADADEAVETPASRRAGDRVGQPGSRRPLGFLRRLRPVAHEHNGRVGSARCRYRPQAQRAPQEAAHGRGEPSREL